MRLSFFGRQAAVSAPAAPSPHDAVMVARIKAESLFPPELRGLLNDPVFADGLVSADRLRTITTSPAEVRRAIEIIQTIASGVVMGGPEHVVREQVESRFIQVGADIDAIEKRSASGDWARTPEAPGEVAALATRLQNASALAQSLVAGLGVETPAWFAAWSGRVAALGTSIAALETKVARAEHAKKREATFAKDVENLSREQMTALANGIEECGRLGIGFRALEFGFLPLPGATIIAHIRTSHGAAYGPIGMTRSEESASYPCFTRGLKPVRSLPELVDIIQEVTKLDLKILEREPAAA